MSAFVDPQHDECLNNMQRRVVQLLPGYHTSDPSRLLHVLVVFGYNACTVQLPSDHEVMYFSVCAQPSRCQHRASADCRRADDHCSWRHSRCRQPGGLGCARRPRWRPLIGPQKAHAWRPGLSGPRLPCKPSWHPAWLTERIFT